MAAMLDVSDVWKSFPRPAGGWLDVLAGVSLVVERHEFVSLLGPSGCGKSTLCNIVAGLFPADAGTVRLEESPLGTARGLVAYMQQKDLLLPWRTVIDNAVLGMEIQGSPRGRSREEARSLLRRFGLSEFERAYPALLSGGMRQRVALVRTLLCRRDVLVLDEPFGALDAMTRSAMQGYLLRLQEEFGRTVLLITHDVEEAVLLSDRVYIMAARPGRIRAEMRMTSPRPRHPADEGIVRQKAEILSFLHEEMAGMFG